MKTVTIGGKEYKLTVTWGKLNRALNKIKYETISKSKDSDGREQVTKIEGKYSVPNIFTQLWEYLDRRWFFKPFFFKFRLKNKINIHEIKKAEKVIIDILGMEDREGKN